MLLNFFKNFLANINFTDSDGNACGHGLVRNIHHYSIAVLIKMAKEAAKKAVREELEKKGQNLHEQLDKALGL